MLARRLGLPLLLVVGWAAVAQAQVELKFRFIEGLQVKNRTTTKTKLSTTFSGTSLVSSSNDVRVTQITNGQRDDQGELTFTVKIESLKSDMRFPLGVVVNFDSAKPDAKPQNESQPVESMLDTLRKAVASTLTYHINAENRVESVEGVEDTGLLASPEEVKAAYQSTLDVLPDKPLKPGDAWEQTVTQGVGPGQVCTLERKFTYVGQVASPAAKNGKSLDKITAVDTAVTYAANNDIAGFQVTKCDLKVESSENTFLFDREAGRFLDLRSKVRIKGRIETSSANGRFPADMELSFESHTEEVE